MIQLYEQPAGCLVQTVGRKIIPIEVTDADVAAGAKQFGNLEVPCRVGPRVGENMQAYKFLDADGREQTVFEMQGRLVLMHVWASWCAPCIESLPAMKAALDDLPADSTMFVGLNVDANPDEGRALAAKNDWNWSHTYLGDDSDMSRQLAVSSVPTYFLIGRDGKLIASSSEWNAIHQQLQQALQADGK